jgi:hypothetical protein
MPEKGRAARVWVTRPGDRSGGLPEERLGGVIPLDTACTGGGCWFE